MPDSKITALTSISTSTDPANDPLVIVDVSDTSMAATGTTKKVTLNQLLGASGTATLASATITGDLTVDTNTLKVDSANNRVGIGTASPSSALHMRNASGTGIFTQYQDTGGINYVGIDNGVFRLANTTAQDLLTIAQSGVFSFLDGAGGTRMTLNSTGLGVGVSPAYKIHANAECLFNGILIGTNGDSINGTTGLLVLRTSGTERLRIDTSGNVGIGVTPSAWAAGFKVLQVGSGPSISTNGNASRCDISTNYYYNAGNKFLTASGYATGISQENGNFYFQRSTTTSGGIGSSLTFDVPMTLDASGNLLVGTTAPLAGNAAKFHLSTNSGTTRWAVGPYSDPNSFIISAVGGSGVYLNGTAATSWTSASDERLKDIIEPISNAIAKVGSLRAVIGKFKFDQNNTRKPFLIAQDLQSVLPEAVDASNPDQLGVAYTDVIPLLVAAIKELTARVQTLETR